ncbi:MAG: FAD:protein FMN transferase [Nitrospirales bacterium]
MLTLGFLATSFGESHSKEALIKRGQYLMGTLVFVTAVATDEETAKNAVAAGLAEIRRIEHLMSTWIPTSELSSVNAAAGKHPVQVGTENMEVLKASLDMATLTKGGFNISVGPAVAAWNVSQDGRIPSQKELDAVRPLIFLSNIDLDETTGTVFLKRVGMQIDVGGIGKGFAADLAVEVMKSSGAVAGVVALSGDIKTFGRMPDQERFVFGIQHPRKEQGYVLGRIELENEAVSTAGDYQRYIMKDGVRYHHILDPDTLHPARGCQSVTIIAKEGVMADGLDTGIFVMGPEKGMALIESLPEVEGVIVDAQGTIMISSGLKSRLIVEP